MQRLQRLPHILPLLPALLLAGACDDPDGTDGLVDGVDETAPDRGAGTDHVTVRAGSSGVGGSTQLNTGKLFADGMPLRHFSSQGAVTYDDPKSTTVKFIKLALLQGGALVSTGTNVKVVDDEVMINEVVIPPSAFLGSQWTFDVADAVYPPRTVTLTVTGVGRATVPGGIEVPMFNFSLEESQRHYETGSLCDALDPLSAASLVTTPGDPPPGVENEFDPRHAAVLYGGLQVTSSGKVVPETGSIYVGCVSGAIGKAALWGYPSWVSSYQGLAGPQQLEAVSRAIRADYGADGTSHTLDGTPIQVRDRFRSSFDDPTEATEAVWGAGGAACQVIDGRIQSGPFDGCPTNPHCNQLGSEWILGAEDFLWTKLGPGTTSYTPKTACTAVAGTPGCADPGIEATVCAVDSYCCNVKWDLICVGEVGSLHADDEACCADNGTPGCGDAAVESCVGGYDSYCTTYRWDSYCAQEVESLGCGLCR